MNEHPVPRPWRTENGHDTPPVPPLPPPAQPWKRTVRLCSLPDKYIHNKYSLAFSLMTANVVSAMLSITGVQSSLPVEDTRLSMAPFMMSIPGDITQESLSSLGSKNLQHEVFQWVFEFTYRSRHRRHPQIVHMKLLHQLGLWHGKLCREKHKNTNFNIRTHTHTHRLPPRDLITWQHLKQIFKRVVHTR